MTKKNTELESGKIKISEDVYATIVTIAALETKGIHHMMVLIPSLDVNLIMKVLRYHLMMKGQFLLLYMFAFNMGTVSLMWPYVYKNVSKQL